MKEKKIGFGTYPLRGPICTQAVKDAVQTGYRIIDTATRYCNFDAIAKALVGQTRSDFYIISKVWSDKQHYGDVFKDLEFTLNELQTNYIDAYLTHWPNHKIPIEETLLAMRELQDQKKIRHIGLSNVTTRHLKKALLAKVPITWVQIEMHPFFFDRELLLFCKGHSIQIQAWAPLARGLVKEDPLLLRMAKSHKKSPSQIALRWILQHNCLPLPGSKTKQHIEENFDIFDFSLAPSEMDEIDARAILGQRRRYDWDEFDFSFEDCWPKSAEY